VWRITVSAAEFSELPPVAAQLLTGFLTISDGSLTHPNDSKRFYEFIRHCHAKRVRLSEEKLNSLLVNIGCSRRQAKEISGVYGHGRNLLKVRCPTYFK